MIDLFEGIGAADAGGNFHVTHTEQVKTTRLDDISGLPEPDFIKLDIQGAELLVLQHGFWFHRFVDMQSRSYSTVCLRQSNRWRQSADVGRCHLRS